MDKEDTIAAGAGSFVILIMGLIFVAIGGCVIWFIGADLTIVLLLQ